MLDVVQVQWLMQVLLGSVQPLASGLANRS